MDLAKYSEWFLYESNVNEVESRVGNFSCCMYEVCCKYDMKVMQYTFGQSAYHKIFLGLLNMKCPMASYLIC